MIGDLLYVTVGVIELWVCCHPGVVVFLRSFSPSVRLDYNCISSTSLLIGATRHSRSKSLRVILWTYSSAVSSEYNHSTRRRRVHGCHPTIFTCLRKIYSSAVPRSFRRPDCATECRSVVLVLHGVLNCCVGTLLLCGFSSVMEYLLCDGYYWITDVTRTLRCFR